VYTAQSNTEAYERISRLNTRMYSWHGQKLYENRHYKKSTSEFEQTKSRRLKVGFFTP